MYGAVKRLLDMLSAILLVPFVLPLILILILFLSLRLRQNPFFLQQRVGKDQRVFTIWKLRTFPL